MFLRCDCGYTMTSVAYPGRVVHLLLSQAGQERLQDSADGMVARVGRVDEWPEIWDDFARAVEAWLCPKCSRLYVGPRGSPESVFVFALERKGIDPAATGTDSDLGSETELLKLATNEAGESPLAP